MEKLPADIVLDIFYRLPPESVLRCTFVCKLWHSLRPGGDGNYFAKIHMRRHHHQSNLDSTLNFIVLHEFRDQEGGKVGEFHITEYDEEELNGKMKIINFPKICVDGWDSRTRLLGSCNGLLCLINQSSFSKYSIGICNPLLHEYVPLPPSDQQYKYGSETNMVIGFGYHSVTDEYKVIRVYYRHCNSDIGDVEVYTLGKRKHVWRSKGTIECRLLGGSSRPVLVNGSLHWLASETEYGIQRIVSFDLGNEEFGVIPLPRYSYMNNNLKLKELGGCLCLSEKESNGMDIWILKDYTNKDSWVKGFSIEWKGKLCYSPCAIKKKKDGSGDEIILWQDTKRLVFWKNGVGDTIPQWYDSKRLVSYDRKTRNIEEVVGGREVVVTESVYDDTDPVLHISSLVSLKFLGEDGKLYRESWRNKGSIRRAKKMNKVVELPWTRRKYVR